MPLLGETMVATWKTKEVNNLAEIASKSRVIGLINIEKIPSSQLQMMRKSLKGTANIRITKNSLLQRSLKKAKIDGLEKHIHGPTALVSTDLNPFKLGRFLKSKRISRYAKGGDIAVKDIIIPEGDTPFSPGPIIGELQKVGIKAQIKGGKIVVTEDSLVVKKGEVIPPELANVLTRIDIKPFEIGLELSAVYENGIIYPRDVLEIDDAKTIENLQTAYRNSINLAMNAGIYNSITIVPLLKIASTNAINLALNANIINKGTIRFILARANVEAQALASKIPNLISK